MSQIKAGKVRPLALFGGQRSKSLPDLPTLKELGFDIGYYLWVGMFAPKNTPASVITYLRDVINKGAHGDQYKTALTNLGLELAYMDQAEFAKFWADDTKRIEDAVRQIGRVEG
jgi:tripartite-type tricarboxylate transporter receptor subunit TctC